MMEPALCSVPQQGYSCLHAESDQPVLSTLQESESNKSCDSSVANMYTNQTRVLTYCHLSPSISSSIALVTTCSNYPGQECVPACLYTVNTGLCKHSAHIKESRVTILPGI
jgi:hypothetical protein